jgi:hypothetical protein
MLAKGLVIPVLMMALQQSAPPPISPQTNEGPSAARPAVRQSAPIAPVTTAAPGSAGRVGSQAGIGARQTPHLAAPNTAAQNSGAATGTGDCNGFPCDNGPQRIVVSNPAPAPAVWSLHEKILWAVYVVLACLGYAGIMLGLSLLKKIERQTATAETAAAAAYESAQAALLNAKALVDAERPWLVVTVEPSPNVDDGFTVTATNRGRSPAQIVGTADQLRIATDESKLPAKPEYGNSDPKPPMAPIILLQGESTPLKSFSRADAKELCESDEQFARIENWEEKIFLYGKVIYKDLITPADKQAHQTEWCSWYIHGRQRSGMVIGGPTGYNAHT